MTPSIDWEVLRTAISRFTEYNAIVNSAARGPSQSNAVEVIKAEQERFRVLASAGEESNKLWRTIYTDIHRLSLTVEVDIPMVYPLIHHVIRKLPRV